jgi:septal ring-binding cell division protein DamX
MKTINTFAAGLFTLSILCSCGPSPEELRQKELARQDSLKKIQEETLAAAKTETPSEAPAAQAPAASPAATPAAPAAAVPASDPVQFDANGKLTLQVEAWRNRKSAEKSVDKWKKRGVDNAYAVMIENPETGEVWYRVRIGKFKTRKMAKKQAEALKEQFQVESWVDNAANEVRVY